VACSWKKQWLTLLRVRAASRFATMIRKCKYWAQQSETVRVEKWKLHFILGHFKHGVEWGHEHTQHGR